MEPNPEHATQVFSYFVNTVLWRPNYVSHPVWFINDDLETHLHFEELQLSCEGPSCGFTALTTHLIWASDSEIQNDSNPRNLWFERILHQTLDKELEFGVKTFSSKTFVVEINNMFCLAVFSVFQLKKKREISCHKLRVYSN